MAENNLLRLQTLPSTAEGNCSCSGHTHGQAVQAVFTAVQEQLSVSVKQDA